MSPKPLPAAVVEFQRASNRETHDRWELFAEHRRRVTALVAGAGAGRLCVLGAGNGNDLDLPALAARFDSIALVDLDEAALARCRARLREPLRARLDLRAPVDLSGALDELPRWRRRPPTRAELQELPARAARRAVAAVGGRHEVVASTCLITQIVDGCRVALGADHPSLIELGCSLVLGHLRALLELTAPGGTAVLVTDVVSSETYPLHELWAERQADPDALLAELAASGNVLTGTSPRTLARLLRREALLAPLAASSTTSAPWLWTFSRERAYLAYALTIARSGAA